MEASVHTLRKYSLSTGIFYLLAFVSIPTLALCGGVRGPAFVTRPGPNSPVMVGVVLKMMVALAALLAVSWIALFAGVREGPIFADP
jgi:hypothetical protein